MSAAARLHTDAPAHVPLIAVTTSEMRENTLDLATNQVRRTIPVLPSPLVAREAGGALWVTDFEQSQLWRIDL